MRTVREYSNLKMNYLILFSIVCLAGCSSQADRDFQNFQKNAKETIDPVKLQTWALSVATNHNNYMIPEQDVPYWIKRADLGSVVRPTGWIGVRAGETMKTVSIDWAGSFLQWGFIIGDTNFSVQDRSESHLYVPWIPGVYFVRY